MPDDSRRLRRRASRWPDTLAGRLASALALFVLLATGTVLGIEYLRGREALLREAGQRLDARDRLVGDRLERALEDRLRLVAVWPGLGAAQDIAVDDVDKRLAASLAQLAGSFHGTDLALAVEPGGRVVASSDPAWIGRSTVGDGLLPLLRRSTAPDARLYLRSGSGQEGVVAASPVFGPRDERLGWLALLTPWSELLAEAAPDDRAGLAIRDAGGRILVGRDPPAGDAELTATHPMRNLGGLRLQTEMAVPVSQALSPLRDTGRQLLTFALVFLAVTLPASLLFARSTTRELRRLTDTAGDVRLDIRPDFDRVSAGAPREVKVLSDALETMVARLDASRRELSRQESLAAMGMMAAGLAHEIRTPLSIVRGSAEMLARDAAPGSRDEELTTFILGEVSRLGRLVNDLLAFARPRPPRLVPIDLADILRQVISAITPEYENAGVSLVAELGPAPLAGDADQLYQVALNLLANARKASDAGQSVEVRTRVRNDDAILEIRDHGKGIPPADLAEVWTPFFTTGGSGTGLGLPIVRRIVEAHDGTVGLDSRVGLGTTATVRIPSGRDA